MSKDKIYIEALALVDDHFSGVGQYILGLLKGLDELIDNNLYDGANDLNIRVIIPCDKIKRFRSFGFKHLRPLIFPLTFRLFGALWHRGLLFPIDILCGRGTYLFTRFVKMPLLFSKSAVIVYDLSFETYPEYSEVRNGKFLNKFVPKTVKKASYIITISNFIKNEIIATYGIESNNIIVALPGTDKRLFYRRSITEIETVKQKYGVKTNYILALSNLEPRKNLNLLVNSYCELPPELRKKYSLLLVGVSGWKTSDLMDNINNKIAQGFKITRPTSYVIDEDKPALISGATLMVYPSHYEGFGLPPLESLSCGSPVLVANNSSLPEAAGDAGIYFNLDAPNDLLSKLKGILEDIDLISNNCVINGPDHARRFSWIKTAQTTIMALRRLT